MSGAAWALIRACHPVPTAAVTTLTTALGVVLDVSAARLALLALAVLAGQLSVGWLNDYVDRQRDRAAGRTDKPLAVGTIAPVTVRWATVAAAVVCVPASLSLGVQAGTAHLVAVAGAWAYNLGVKRTLWSWVPYAVGFGLLPVIVWVVSPQPGVPPWWMIAGSMLLGVGAHGANVLPDLDVDRVTGVAGLPHRVPRGVLRAATALVLLGSLTLLTLGPAQTPVAVEAVLLVAGTVLAAVAAGVGESRLPARAPLLAAASIAALAIAALLAGSVR
ncbi:MAG TPA: UbiA family prenyltransferase [Jiangellaceae bacterium]